MPRGERVRRIGTDRIDLYYAHRDEPDTAQEETLDAFDALVPFTAIQPHYNLMERDDYETAPHAGAHARRATAAVPSERDELTGTEALVRRATRCTIRTDRLITSADSAADVPYASPR